MQIPFVGGAYTDRSTNVNAQTCINLFPVVSQQDAKVVTALYNTPGLAPFPTPTPGTSHTYVDRSGASLCVRGLHVFGDTLYAIINDKVYSINSAGSATFIGFLSTRTGIVSIANNGTQVMIVDGTRNGYVITDDVMIVVTDTEFPVAQSITFQDGYFIIVEKDTGNFFISELYNGLTWSALDFEVAEGRPDNALAVVSNTQDLWIFGEKSVEVFYNSGDTDFPFARISGALIDTGCAAVASPAKINGLLYWLSDRGQVCRNSGYLPQFISTPEIEYLISTFTLISDAIGFTYSVEGHHFYVLTFPTADKTLVYDTTTGFWHEWQGYKFLLDPWGRSRVNCAALFNRQWVGGDYQTGLLYVIDMNCYTDYLQPIRRERAAQVISKDRTKVIHHQLEIEFEAGVGLTGSGQGADPEVMLDWSDDGGHTWSNVHKKHIGKIGKYKNRAVWKRLGRSQNRIYRVMISDPVKVVILGAYAEFEECKG